MGESVLTPEESLLGKACEAVGATQQWSLAAGEREFGPTFRNLLMGNRGCEAVGNGGRRVAEPEESSLFSLT